jgi:hypothetical protein
MKKSTQVRTNGQSELPLLNSPVDGLKYDKENNLVVYDCGMSRWIIASTDNTVNGIPVRQRGLRGHTNLVTDEQILQY